ncbi:MAG: helix-turn-helix domain-containing protein [Christensenellales bacterium]
MQKVIRDADFGRNLKEIRLKKGFSQNVLVSKMQTLGSNISRSGYSMIELGTRNMKATDLVAFSLVCEVAIDSMFIGIKPDDAKPYRR